MEPVWAPVVAGPTAAVDLPMGVQHPIKAAFRTDIQPAIGQNGHDLSRRQRREFGLIAGEQDPLAFLLAEAVGHMAAAALATIHTVPITRKLAVPTLQRGEANTQQQGQLSGTSTSGNPLIHDLESLLAVFGRGHSSASSPQKAWIFFAANSSAAASASAFSLRRSSCYSVGEAFG